MRFFPGLHHPWDAKHFTRSFISVSTLEKRKSDFQANDWILDSGAFSTILRYGGYPNPVEQYAAHVRRWKTVGNLLAAVSQDYMCEPSMLRITGKSVREHQELTIARYDTLLQCDTGCYILPVLQGYDTDEYLEHIEQYGDRLKDGEWVGVGSVCKRNVNPCVILDVLAAIKSARPDLRLHGFGLKKTALSNGVIRSLLESADSMAWSYAARREGRNANDYREALSFTEAVEKERPYQGNFIELFLPSKVLNG